MSSYLSRATRAQTPQSRPLPGSNQVENSAGGFVWQTDKWDRLARFLILGSEGGTYYIGEHDLTFENVACLHECMDEDGARYVTEIVDISTRGRAPKNDQAIFALAYAITNGDIETRKLAATAIPQVCRIGTHLFMLLDFLKGERGWGPLLRAAVSRWYTERDADSLAYQAVKYRQRGGWSHADVLSKAHPKPPSEQHAQVFGFISGNVGHQQLVDDDGRVTRKVQPWPSGGEAPAIIEGFLAAQRAKTPKETAALVREFKLPREALNTDHLNDPVVWEAMLDAGMPMTALIRNLATMTRNGLLTPTSVATGIVLRQLADGEVLRKARVHPLSVLIGLVTYQSGVSYRGRGDSWVAVPQIVDALDAAFYKAFDHIEPTGKRWLLGVDISGSMSGATCHGAEMLRTSQAAAAMAMVVMRSEPLYEVIGYDSAVYDLGLSAGMRLPDVMTAMAFQGGRTDCAIPMRYAADVGREADVILILTDNETWSGLQHPAEALKAYRKVSGIDTKLIVVGMASNGFTVADPNDAGMLDVVGFDASVPTIMAEFAKGSM